jgi:hypothetical protein
MRIFAIVFSSYVNDYLSVKWQIKMGMMNRRIEFADRQESGKPTGATRWHSQRNCMEIHMLGFIFSIFITVLYFRGAYG